MNSKQLHSITYDLARVVRAEAGFLMKTCHKIQTEKDFPDTMAINEATNSVDQIEKAIKVYMAKILA